MASTQAAAALLTAVSIGIAAISVLINNMSFALEENGLTSRGKYAKKASRKFIFIIGYFTSTIFTAFSSSIYYLYMAEFPNSASIISERAVFIIASIFTLMGLYTGIIGIGISIIYRKRFNKIKEGEKIAANLFE